MKVDYLTFTVWNEDALAFFELIFGDTFGIPTLAKNGGLGYRSLYLYSSGVRMYSDPVVHPSCTTYDRRFTVSIPGQGCSCLLPHHYQDLIAMAITTKIAFTRVDLAFDRLPFTPKDIWQLLQAGKVKTRAKRSSFSMYDNPFQLREDGVEGCSTVYIGSATSDRRVRVYDMHGFTRVELQLRAEWADTVGRAVFGLPFVDWLPKGIEFLKQYLDFPQMQVWVDLFGSYEKANVIVKSARRLDYDRMLAWLANQVAPAVFVAMLVEGRAEFWNFINSKVDEKRLKKYRNVMQLREVPPKARLIMEDLNNASSI